MSVEANVRLVRRYVEDAVNGGDLAVLDETHAPTYRSHVPSRPDELRTREDLRRQLTGIRSAYPDGRFTIEDLIAADDKVVVRYFLRGTHATKGKAIAATGFMVFRLADGQVVEYCGQADDLTIGRQLGEIPPAAPGAAWLDGLGDARSWQRSGVRAPHKPLLLLPYRTGLSSGSTARFTASAASRAAFCPLKRGVSSALIALPMSGQLTNSGSARIESPPSAKTRMCSGGR
jgi:predicted ester cyclase